MNKAILTFILLIASALRLYRIGDYMTFLGDEGRDVLIAKAILEGDFTLLGPRSSAADFFYGPIYYYFITPFLWIFNYDPVGPAVGVALFGIATVYLVYKFGSEFFGVKAGLIAALLYSISPLVIAYSRSSWNPNPLPFFSLLIIFLTYKAVFKNSLRMFALIGLLFGIAMQLQYLATFLTIVVVTYVFLGTYIKSKGSFIKSLVIRYVLIVFGFLIGFSPFLIFEIRHGFPNTRTILDFIFVKSAQSNYEDSNTSFASIILDVFFRIYARLVANFPPPEQININENFDLKLWTIAIFVVAIATIFALSVLKDKLKLALIACWMAIGIFLFGFYKTEIYDYYFGFLFPLPFLLVGNLISVLYFLKNKSLPFSKIIATILLICLILINLKGIPFRFSPNKQKAQVKTISEFVLSKTDGKPFNFALITLGNSDHAYRYFFELNERVPVTIENEENDPKRKTVTGQLLIVCEDPNCQPLGDPLWEVAGFGRGEIAGQWDVSVVKIFKLVHYKGKD